MRLLRDRRAATALLFGLAALPIIGLIGAGVDFAFVFQAKTQLNAAADTAAMAATTTAAAGFTAGQPSATYMSAGKTAGTQWFNALAGAVPYTTVQAPTVTLTKNGNVFTTTVTFGATTGLTFGPLFSQSTATVGGNATATLTTAAYLNITFLLDNSSSMMLAATQAGINQMNALTPLTLATSPAWAPLIPQSSVPSGLGGLPCAFACHWDATNKDYYGMARSYGIQLRFDVVQQATQNALTTMIAQEKFPGQFTTTVLTFNKQYSQIYPAGGQASSTDLVSAGTAVKGIATPVTLDIVNTYFPSVMSTLASAVTQAGDGGTSTTPKKVLIMVTDGMMDQYGSDVPGNKGPINPSICDAIKAKGYNLYVLYTTYIDDPIALPFNMTLEQFLTSPPSGQATGTPSLMAQALTACASTPANFVQAADPASILAAMDQIVNSALGNGGRFSK